VTAYYVPADSDEMSPGAVLTYTGLALAAGVTLAVGMYALSRAARSETPEEWADRIVRAQYAKRPPVRLDAVKARGGVARKIAAGSSTGDEFFHGSYEPLPVNTVLEAQKNKQRARAIVEKVADTARPSGAPPRWQAWYMTIDPCKIEEAGGSDKFTYRVRPVGPVVAVNYDWFSKIQTRFLKEALRTGLTPESDSAWARSGKKLAEKYWSNAPSKDQKDQQTEYLTPAVEIVERVRCVGRRAKRRSR
jgi:hypothetical protein